jgi:hypothetical protein
MVTAGINQMLYSHRIKWMVYFMFLKQKSTMLQHGSINANPWQANNSTVQTNSNMIKYNLMDLEFFKLSLL